MVGHVGHTGQVVKDCFNQLSAEGLPPDQEHLPFLSTPSAKSNSLLLNTSLNPELLGRGKSTIERHSKKKKKKI